MVFGVFDGIHEGHRMFLKQAKKQGDVLIAAVARDEAVLELKGKLPQKAVEERIQNLRESGLVDAAIAGDKEIGTWKTLEQIQPHVVVLGYDQAALGSDLKAYISERGAHIAIHVMEPHEPEKYHSSFLNHRDISE